jgi:hypothetical protein
MDGGGRRGGATAEPVAVRCAARALRHCRRRRGSGCRGCCRCSFGGRGAGAAIGASAQRGACARCAPRPGPRRALLFTHAVRRPTRRARTPAPAPRPPKKVLEAAIQKMVQDAKSKALAKAAAAAGFLPSKTFQGRRRGYVFTTGAQGTGCGGGGRGWSRAWKAEKGRPGDRGLAAAARARGAAPRSGRAAALCCCVALNPFQSPSRAPSIPPPILTPQKVLPGPHPAAADGRRRRGPARG